MGEDTSRSNVLSESAVRPPVPWIVTTCMHAPVERSLSAGAVKLIVAAGRGRDRVGVQEVEWSGRGWLPVVHTCTRTLCSLLLPFPLPWATWLYSRKMAGKVMTRPIEEAETFSRVREQKFPP